MSEHGPATVDLPRLQTLGPTGILRATMRFAVTILTAILMSSGVAKADYLGAYDYPFVNPLAATVAATPAVYQADLPDIESLDFSSRTMRVFPERSVPDVFWYFADGLQYAVVEQPRPAPVVFLIAGTGSPAESVKSTMAVKAIAKAGMHVVSLPNPTHPNFIVTASSGGVPGRMENDAADLTRVMERILTELREEVEITGVHVAGYSLGGMHAAFVAYQDEQERRLGIDRVLIMNPPVELYSSAKTLDAMLERHVSTDPDGVRRFIDYVYNRFLGLYDRRQNVDFTDDFLYRAYSTLEPSDTELETLIGFVFRTTALDLAFASDVMNGGGYLTPQGANLTASTSLTNTLISGIDLSFADYIEEVYLPHFRGRISRTTNQELIDEGSLREIEPWLRTTDRVGLIGNVDDVILTPDEVRWLEDVFGDRAALFPTGGHCGNLDQRDYVARIVDFLRRSSPAG